MRNLLFGLAVLSCSLWVSLEPSCGQLPPVNSEEKITLQYPRNSVEDILRGYEQLTGKRLVKDSNLGAGVQLSIVVPEPVPKSEAILLIEAALLLNGYAIIPVDEKTIKVINSTGGKNPRSEGLPIYANLESLPKTEQVIVYFMPLRYLTTAEAMPILQQQIVLHPGYGSLVAAPNTEALLITENVSVVRKLAELQNLIDVPPARVISQFISLQRADAERVSDAITKLLEARKNNHSSSKSQNGSAPPGGAGENSGGSNESASPSGQVQLVADSRTNRILVVTRPVNFDYVQNLIRQFDQAADVTEPFERPLKYVPAGEILPVLQKALAETKEEAAAGAGEAGPNHSSQGANRASASSTSAAATTTGGEENLLGQVTSDQDTAPASLIVGKARIIADKRANSILVMGPPETVAKVRALLDLLDKRPRQVYLATVIGQLEIDSGDEFGIDLLQKYSRIGQSGLASGLRTRASGELVPEPKSLVASSAFPLPSGLTVYGAVGSTLDAYVKALETSNRFKVIARPSVYTANNKEAVISSGQEVPVPSSTLSTLNTGTANNAAVTANIEYRKVLLELKVVPLINADKEVTLQIAQKNDTLGASQTISGITVPSINTQQVGTTVTVQNRDTVVLGGLISETTQRGTIGFPGLSDIPVLGYLFRDTTHSSKRVELIILIQPNVIDTQEEVEAENKTELDRVEVGPETWRTAQPPVKPAKPSKH